MAQAAISDKPQSLESIIEAMPPRLLNTLSLIASGATNPVIAERLGIAEKTLGNHINAIFLELGISNDDMYDQRVKAVLLYLERFPEDKGKYQREFFEDLAIEPLTPREYDVLSLVAQGYSNAYIAGKLSVKKKIVENYINVIYKKLNIHSYEGTSPRVMAMLMFERVPAPSDKEAKPNFGEFHLTNMGSEVFALIASAHSNQSIGNRLGIAEKSVENYVTGIFSKLGIAKKEGYNPRVKAVLMYREQLTADLRQAGLIDGEQYAFEFFKERLAIEPLTPREYDVLSLVAQGYSNEYIAGKLSVREKTVENHVNAIYDQLNIHSYEGTSPRVMAMLMFDRIPQPNGYKTIEPQLVQLVEK